MAEYIERETMIQAIREYSGFFQDSPSTNHMILKMEAEDVARDLEAADVISAEWIKADERLPDDERDGETVLAIVSGKPHENITLCQAIMLAGYFGEEGWLVNEYPEWERPVVTHWMPLPGLPKNK